MKFVRVGLLASALTMTACPGIGDMLRLYGYTEIKPPSTLFAPGTMVWVKKANPFEAGIVCTVSKSLGADFVPLQSPTQDGRLTKATDTAVDLEAKYMDIVKGDVRFEAIKNITVKLNNPLIFEVNDVDVINAASNRDPVCKMAIEARREAKFKVTMIASSLQADVVYSVEWKTDTTLDVQAKIATLQNLALALGLDVHTFTATTMEGKALYWGIKDDAYLANLTEDPNSRTGQKPGQPELDPSLDPNIIIDRDPDVR
jgi:hypothetical protein